MLDQLAVSDFIGHVNAMFRVVLGLEDTIDLELIEAKAIGEHPVPDSPGTNRQPFSLIFRGPRERLLPQHIHPVEHPTLGTLDIFLVPLGPEGDPTGLHYQAVFN
jgi:hypothetical protein